MAEAKLAEVKPVQVFSTRLLVQGRNRTSWGERFELDVWYVDHVSFWLDLRILARTLLTVVRREGISARDHATMPPFTGNHDPNESSLG